MAQVKQIPEAEVPVEILAQAIVDVAEAAKKLLNGRLSRRAILILIQDNVQGKQIGLREIGEILDSAAGLDRAYVKQGKGA